MVNTSKNKILNVPNERDKSFQNSLDSAECSSHNPKANVPNLRFPEFKDEWGITQLGNIGQTYNGLTGKSGEDFGKGFPYITYKSVFDSSKIDISRVDYVNISDEELKNRNQNEVKYGDIFFTTSSETPEEVGMVSVLLDKIDKCFLNSFCFGYRLSQPNKYNPTFMRFYLRSQPIRRKLNVIAQGSTRFNISKNEVMKMKISLPQEREQQKIAHFLTLLDERIEAQSKIIKDLEKLKSAIRKLIFDRVLQQYESNMQICDLLSYEQPTRYIISETEYSIDSTLIPVLTANKAFILGFTKETVGVYRKGECIILDDFSLDCKIVDFPFKVKSSAIKILTAKPNISIRYMYEYLKYLDLDTSEHKRHYITDIEPMEIAIPPQIEMDSITRLLYTLDKRCSNAQDTLKMYQTQKMYLLNQMFI